MKLGAKGEKSPEVGKVRKGIRMKKLSVRMTKIL